MDYTREKNGYLIVVKKWDNTVSIYDAKTNELIKAIEFGDHVKAVAVAENL